MSNEKPLSVEGEIVSTQDFIKLLEEKLHGKVSGEDILSIIDILLEEITDDLLDGKIVDIYNFGRFSIYRHTPRLSYDFSKKKKRMTKMGTPKFRFKFLPRIGRFLRLKIDSIKTFGTLAYAGTLSARKYPPKKKKSS